MPGDDPKGPRLFRDSGGDPVFELVETVTGKCAARMDAICRKHANGDLASPSRGDDRESRRALEELELMSREIGELADLCRSACSRR